MIDEEKTYAEKGYRSSDLKQYSKKKVFRVCDGCGDGMWVMFMACSDLCRKCSLRNRHIQNHKIQTEKRDCIDDDVTFAEKGYRSTWLKPNSLMKVYRVCACCGEGKWIMYCSYRDVCNTCTRKMMRKYNYDYTDDIVRSIDEDKTFREKGYRSSDLSDQSGKKVWAVCVECGYGRWVSFQQYRDLCMSCVRKKENGSNWKGGITSENARFRASREYIKWRISVFERDGYTCQECGQVGGNLNAHHILPYSDWRDHEYSLNVDNGITLCKECHDSIKGREYEYFSKYFDIVNGVVKK